MSVKYPTYVSLTSSSEEQPNERTPSPPPRKKSLLPPQAPSKSITSKSAHYTSSSSPSESSTPTHVAPPPKLSFILQRKQEPQELLPLQMNKADLDTMSMDDLFNNLKVYEPEVKGISSSSSSTQNMAFVSSSNKNTSSSNEAVNVAHGVTTASTQINTANSSNVDNLSDVVIYAFLASQPNKGGLKSIAMRILALTSLKWSATTATRGDILLRSAELQEIKTTRRKAQEGSDQAEEGPNYALVAYSSSSSDLESQIVDNCKKGLDYNAVPPPYIGNFMPSTPDLSFTGLDEFVNKPVVENRKSDKEVSEIVRKNDDALIIEEWVSDNKEENVTQPKVEKKIVKPSFAKIEFVKPKGTSARKTAKQVEQLR
ncbi:hypothetical protein Tco_0677567 [Tanacetum coccineum]|uniref:Uncharacterized protein n=1 Tax=Tanacetum coccineum TaxID=301880 RepID=A0ABQ4XDG8_9ASTR